MRPRREGSHAAPTQSRAALLTRWLKFNAVGAMGICVQMLVVCLFGSVLNISSLWATTLAVEASVLHNFLWHEHFTWVDRCPGGRGRTLHRLLAFQLTTGAVSIAGNLLFVSWFLHELHAPLPAANLFAVAACSLFNFIVSDKIVFRGAPQSLQASPNDSALLASH